MKFADTLFRRYNEPFRLIDNMISNSMLNAWLDDFAEGENDHLLWDVWVHKVYDKTFDEFKASLMQSPISEEDTADIVSGSVSILQGFSPLGADNGTV